MGIIKKPKYGSNKIEPHLTLQGVCFVILREFFFWTPLFERRHCLSPPRLPDLSPRDLFLWGHLRVQVYKSRPTSLQVQKEAITQAVDVIPPEMTRRELWTTFGKDFVDVSQLEHAV
ncbi:hypothetical protein TNCV_2087191 [Trichonephila clavipes]|nr:hypothetical protein TNCV_2087191 [Trichonephila clavipes]